MTSCFQAFTVPCRRPCWHCYSSLRGYKQRRKRPVRVTSTAKLEGSSAIAARRSFSSCSGASASVATSQALCKEVMYLKLKQTCSRLHDKDVRHSSTQLIHHLSFRWLIHRPMRRWLSSTFRIHHVFPMRREKHFLVSPLPLLCSVPCTRAQCRHE